MAKAIFPLPSPMDQPTRRGTDEPLVEALAPSDSRWTDEAEDCANPGQVRKGNLGEDEGPSPRPPVQSLTHNDKPFKGE